MALSIFDRTVGDGNVVWPSDHEAQASLAIDVLDAVQTVVDVLVDGGVAYKASFSSEQTAHTDFERRNVVVTSKPLREGGRPMADIIDIITGFVVHEVGHTKLDDDVSRAAEKEWPGKVVPSRLLNILQDVRLERFMVSRFPGLAGIFEPTFDWVAAQTIPAGTEVSYGARIAERVNFVASLVRYRKYVTFGTDATTQSETEWWERWGDIAGDASNDELIRLVREGVAHIHVGADTSTPPPPTGPGPEGPVLPPQNPPKPPTEDADDDDDGTEYPGGSDPEGDDEPGEDDDEPEGDDGDGDSEPDDDGEDDDSDDDDGEGKGEGKGKSSDDDVEPGSDDDEPVDAFDREKMDGPMGRGAGGDGSAIAEATPDDVDEGLERDKLDKTMDELAEGTYYDKVQDERIQTLADRERGSERIKAGIYGTMKVRVNL